MHGGASKTDEHRMMNEDRKNTLRILAPAKVNLSLRIIGRRPDGYHLLDSLMAPVSLYDEITVEVMSDRRGITVDCDDPTIPCDETNLAYKAAALLCREANLQVGVALSLRKHIPAGAGLGGGSSNAASVLKSLNTLFSLGLTEDRLCALATRLGADVPFFIPCRPMQVGGIGEVLTEVPLSSVRWLVIVVPPFGVSTPWAYQRFDELFPTPPHPGALPQGEGGPLIAWLMSRQAAGQWLPADLLVNDLEKSVLPQYPLIGQLKDHLLHLGAEGALMSGSGSAVFGVFQNAAAAKQAQAILREQGKTFVVETINGPPSEG